jgi:5-(carboxyamino)imidazole ribonucleotide mutase
VNAGLLAAAILATSDPALAIRLDKLRDEQTQAVDQQPRDPTPP